jgi:hypothetical protein
MPRKQKPQEQPEDLTSTTRCEGVETVIEPIEHDKCDECNLNEYRNGKCHHHYRLSQGYIFDEVQKLYVLKKKGKHEKVVS